MKNYPFSLRRPLFRSQLLLSTALIGIGTLVAPAVGYGQDYYLDNTQEEGDTGLEPESGTWNLSSTIWRKNGNGAAVAWPDGSNTAVLTVGADDDAGNNDVTLTYGGTEPFTPDEIRLDSGKYTLAGGTIGASGDELRLNNQADTWAESLTIDAALAGSVVIGDGVPGDPRRRVIYRGNSLPSEDVQIMDDLTVEADAWFRSTGTTTGELTNLGRADLDGIHYGTVRNTDGAVLSGNGTIDRGESRDRALQNDSGTIFLNGETLKVVGGVDNSTEITPELSEEEVEAIPSATLTGYGTLAGAVFNHEKGTIETGGDLYDGTGGELLIGRIKNDGTIILNDNDTLAGSLVENHGSVSITGSGMISGNLIQMDGGTLNLDPDGELLVGSFTNDYFIEPAQPHHSIFRNPTLIIEQGQALRSRPATDGDIVNNGVMEVRNGTLDAAGQIRNNPGAGLLLYDGAQLKGQLVNENSGGQMGTIRVTRDATATITGEVLNHGLLEVAANKAQSALTVQGPNATFVNTGVIDVRKQSSTLTITADEIQLLESSDIEAGRVAFDGTVTNAGTLKYVHQSSKAKLFGELTNTDTGILAFQREIDGGGQDIVNLGRMTVEPTDGIYGGWVKDLGTLTNWNSLTVATFDDKIGDLSAATILNRGDITLKGGSITATERFSNYGDGHILLNSGSIRADDLRNAGTLQGAGTIYGDVTNIGKLQELSGEITGRLTHQDGTFDINESLSVGSLTNDTDILIDDGETLALTTAEVSENNGTITVSGALSSEGTIKNNTEASLILSGGKVSGDVENSGEISGSGTIDGVLTITGGDTQADPEVLAGQLIVGDSDTIAVVDGIENSGAIDVSGELSTDGVLNNNAGGSLILNGGKVEGIVNNHLGGVIDVEANSDIVGKLTNSGKIEAIGVGTHRTLDIEGDFINEGVIDVQDGDSLLTINAATIALNKGSAINVNQVELFGTVQNNVKLNYSEDGAISGELINGTAGQITISAAVDGQGNDIDNQGSLLVTSDVDSNGNLHNVGNLTNSNKIIINADASVSADNIINEIDGVMRVDGTLSSSDSDIANKGVLDVSGVVNGRLNNSGGKTTLSDGTINGDVANSSTLSGAGTIDGSLANTQDGNATLGGAVGAVTNAGQLQTGGDLSVASLKNTGHVKVNEGDALKSDHVVNNQNSLQIDGTLQAGLNNHSGATTTLSGGKVTRSVKNSGTLKGSGTIGGQLTHNEFGTLNIDGKLSVDSLLNKGEFSVGSGDTLSSDNGVDNDGTITVNGTLIGGVDNSGTYKQSGILDGSLVTTGKAYVGGRVAGNLDYVEGMLALNDGVTIEDTLFLRQDYTVNNTVNASRTKVLSDVELQLGGTLSGSLVNDGTVTAGDGAKVGGVLRNNDDGILVASNDTEIGGILRNNGIVSLQKEKDEPGDVLTTGGLAGSGSYALDVNLSDFTADRIVVEGGAATGHYDLQLNYIGEVGTTQIGERVTLLDVDDALGAENDFTYIYNTTSTASEKLVYSVEQPGANGDVYMIGQVNPAIGAVFGNVKLTQSLIGSVVNRPTSPFVTGLAFEDPEKPCGVGSWGRGTGGTAKATGATDNGVSKIESTVDATYYGMQVGTDFACFDGRYAGWNMSFGGFLGVNQGDTTQPVYAVDGRDSRQVTRVLRSRNEVDFDQLYAGVYATATKGRMQADLQYRHERTDFTIDNKPVTGEGLGLDNADFASTGSTLSGSFSYILPVGDDGWTVVPNVGFAYSRLSTDSIEFSDEFQLDFEDNESKVGFAGATIAKTFVQPESNSAIYAFATGTVYKDFADPGVSFLSRPGDESFEPQRMTTDHLGTYGEISLGANYVKVLQPGPGLRPRQLSASARLDARAGDGLESVGLTGQLRLQF
ncbi:hypothetical protein SAMN05421772_101563 [Paracoccus saliphilus]|uniref:Autotransporter domain-containing protein n=2 Tax=Paracoccus saliphilus TaxID=405559 RepID=A0AA46A489_9RHOB|nr:hypothetical protein JHX88_02435 [Paracoccus saliphilus]SIS57331.1 hypothetical protein SAMN05421772_101563 [Paracoccus saliphilus]